MEEKSPLIYNKTSKLCICGCGESLPVVKGVIQLYAPGHRARARERGRHKIFYTKAYAK